MKRTQWARHLLHAVLLLIPVLAPAGSRAVEPREVPDNASHAALSCRRCHLGNAAADVARDRACTGCHAGSPTGVAAALGFHGPRRSDCTRCHSFHDTSTITTAAGPLHRTGRLSGAVGAHCATCHGAGRKTGRLNEAHVDAGRLYHAQADELARTRPSQGCLNCHDRSSPSAWRTGTQAGELTFDLHATHPLGVVVQPGSGVDAARIRRDIDPAIPLFDERIECQTCHDITAATRDLLIPFASPKELCLGCHQLKDEPILPSDALLATMAPGAGDASAAAAPIRR